MGVFLREIIQNAPSSGIPLDEVRLGLKERLQNTGTTMSTYSSTDMQEEVLPPSWTNVLTEVNDSHYVCAGILYPFNWEEIMRSVAVSMPPEGVTEKEFINRIVRLESKFSSSSLSLHGPVSEWVQRWFSHIFHVSRSAATGVPIYRLVEEPMSPEAESISRALQLLGRGKLPVYTDLALIAPLLPTSINPGKGGWMSFLERDDVQRYFDVNVEAFVRISPDRSPSTVCVDATSVDVARIDEILAAKGLLDSLCSVKLFRRADGPSRSADDVVMQSFLDPEHAIGAAIASFGKESDVNVYVLCGDAVKDRYKVALADLLGHEGSKIKICTPNTEEMEAPVR
ncbi:uncharacterized protein TM35_000122000 [Trypanosoma theileri]|uniref:Uncharacterized protein n=1 Tax=Trypanosoma theileri TaxID=67003 RepID=A0A1X0NXL2_9TRYP|nr:uncharacterized protein TM35_000122000 [Trypanosoma theileri]ORC89425.1 hypothetical protein TM35_000122000 [Trypanosoma theileri]